MEDNVGTIVIGTKVSNKGLEKGLKETQKIVGDFDKKQEVNIDVDADINSKMEKKFKELYSKYEKGTFKEQYLPTDQFEDINVSLEKMKNRLEEMNKQMLDFKDVVNSVGGLENFSSLSKENKENVELTNKMMKSLANQMNMATENIKAYEIENEKNLSVDEARTNELDKQIEKNKEITRQLKYINGLKSDGLSASGLDLSSVKGLGKGPDISTDGIDNIEEKASKVSSAISGVMSKVGDLGKKAFSVVGKILGKVLEIGFAVAGITISAGVFGTMMAVLLRSVQKVLEENRQLIANFKYIAFMVTRMIENIASAITGKIGGALQGIANIVYSILVLIGRLISAIFKIDVFAGITNEEFRKWNENVSGASAGLDSAVGSAKDLKKQLAGFDEMNVLQEPSTGGGTGGGGGGVGVDLPLPDFGDIQEMEPPQWLQWILDNGPLIIGVITGIATALGLIKLGLDPITSSGIGLLVAGLITSIGFLLEYLQDPSWENFGGIIKGIGIAIAGLGVLIGGLPAVVVGAILAIIGVIVENWEKIKIFLEEKLKWIREKGDELYKNGTGFVQKFIGFFLQMFGGLFEWFIKTLDNLFKTWKGVFDGIIEFVKGIFTGNWKQAWNGIGTIVSSLVNNILGLFQNLLNLILGYFSRIGTAVGDVIGGSFKSVINSVLDWVQNKINSFIRAINKVINKVNDIPGINITKLSEVSLPRMKTGAIINQPGRGVPVGIGGEAGKEGILPLTDARAMQLLGQEIGKWITINANITNTMNGRVISRELQKINNENDFAFNS